jgi:hypothetical protein
MKRFVRLAAVGVAAAGALVVAQAPAHADPSSCTTYPAPGNHGGNPASVTCPAGAGTFTFRVAAVCADAYPNSSHPYLHDEYGPWVQASATSATTSAVTCNGYVPGSGFAWSASIQVQ